MKRKKIFKVPKPFTRTPIPPKRVETDRSKKHPRQRKHKHADE